MLLQQEPDHWDIESPWRLLEVDPFSSGGTTDHFLKTGHRQSPRPQAWKIELGLLSEIDSAVQVSACQGVYNAQALKYCSISPLRGSCSNAGASRVKTRCFKQSSTLRVVQMF